MRVVANWVRVNLKDGRPGNFLEIGGDGSRVRIDRRVVVRERHALPRCGQILEIIYDLAGGSFFMLSMQGRSRVNQPIMLRLIVDGPRIGVRDLHEKTPLTYNGFTYECLDGVQEGIAYTASSKESVQWYTYVGPENAVLRVVKMGGVTTMYHGYAYPDSSFDPRSSTRTLFRIFRRR